jgi:hypothetical protein
MAAAQPAVVVAESVPPPGEQFTLVKAIALLRGSTAAHIAGYLSLAVSIVTLYSILRLIGDDSASEEGSTCNGDFMMSQKRYVACVHRPRSASVVVALQCPANAELTVRLSIAPVHSTACTFATGQVIPLAKITRDRFVASLHEMEGAPNGLKAISGTTESYITALFFFIVSIGFCVHSVRVPAQLCSVAVLFLV